MYVIAPLAVKDAHFMAVVRSAGQGAGGVIVFCARRSTCEVVATLMQQLGCRCSARNLTTLNPFSFMVLQCGTPARWVEHVSTWPVHASF